jgi:hypothetical protein
MDSPYPLPALPYVRLRCTLRAEAPAVLPPFKGSLLRGAFGHALRRLTCAFGPHQACADCALRHTCAYPRIFETRIEADPPPFLRGLPTSPRPYIFEPGTDERSFSPGDPLPFDLLLLGQAADLQAYALLAIERMARNGLGRDRIPFVLDDAKATTPSGTWKTVYAEGRISPALATLQPLLRFLTPTRLMVRGTLQEEPGFRPLVFAALRRALELSWFHHPEAPLDWNFHSLLDRASKIRIPAKTLRWHDWERYSNRQGRKIEMGGFVGMMHLEGDLQPFTQLLRMTEVLHVGKGATFGLGRVAVD